MQEQVEPEQQQPEQPLADAPTDYDEFFNEAGEKHNINPRILKSIAQVESGFREDVITGKTLSEKGAEGIMQFMPATRKALEEKYNVPIDPFDPRSAINGGALLMRELITKYEKAGSDDPLGDALEDYNGGPNLVRQSSQTADYRDKVISNLRTASPQPVAPPTETLEQTPAELPMETALREPRKPDDVRPLVGEVVASKKDIQNIKYKDLYMDNDYFNVVEEYMEVRLGKDGARKENETKKEYVDRFATHMRNVAFNNLDLGNEAIWTSYATQDEKRKAGFAFEIWDAVPTFDDNKFKAAKDIGVAIAFDPLTYLGFGVGKVATMVAAKAGTRYFGNTGVKLINELGLIDKSRLAKRAVKDIKKRGDVKGKAQQVLEKVEARAKRTGMGLAAVTEGSIGATSGLLTEKLAVSQERQEEINKTNIAISTGLSAVFGGAAGLGGATFNPVGLLTERVQLRPSALKTAQEYDKILQGKKVKLNPDEEKLVQGIDKHIKEITSSLDVKEGKATLKRMSDELFRGMKRGGEDLIDVQVRYDIVKKSFAIAGRILQANPEAYGYKLSDPITEAMLRAMPKNKAKDYKVGQRIILESPEGRTTFDKNGNQIATKEAITETLSKIVSDFEELDDVILDKAAKLAGQDARQFNTVIHDELKKSLVKQGLDFKDLGDMDKATVSNAGRTLAISGWIKRTMGKMSQLDPEAQKLFDKVNASEMPYENFGVVQKILDMEKNTKVLVTSGLATTVRNVLGTGAAISMNGAADILEATLYTVLKPLSIITNGKIPEPAGTYSIGESIKNTTELFLSMGNYGMTSEVVDNILVDNPALKNKLISSLQESGTSDIWKFSKLASTLNLTQDAFFRKTMFLGTLKSELKKAGLKDVDHFLANKIQIPPSILQKAGDTAMKLTFTYAPKRGEMNIAKVGVERAVESFTADSLRLIESFPGSSLAITFPRFAANALAFQYRYSPIGSISGVYDMIAATAKNKPDLDEKAQAIIHAQFREGTQKLAKGMVGTTLLAYAVMERQKDLNNADPNRPVPKWYESLNDDGSMSDIRPLFPIAPYYAIADYIVKSDLIESSLRLFGKDADAERDAKVKRGTQDYNLKEPLEAVLGMRIPSGTQGYIIDRVLKASSSEKLQETILKDLASGVSDFFGRVIQPGKPFVDFLSQFSEGGTIARDPNYMDILDKEGLVPGAFKVGANRLINRLPFAKDTLPEAVNYFRSSPPNRPTAFFSNFTGVNVTPKLNRIESQLEKHSIRPWKYFRPTGLRAFDKAVIANSYGVVAVHLNAVLDRSDYESLSYNEKQTALHNALIEAVNQSSDLTLKKSMTAGARFEQLIPFKRYQNLKGSEKRQIRDEYFKDTGKQLSETKDYQKAMTYKGTLDRLDIK